MPKAFTISAKDLGSLALPDFCPRDFWVRQHAPQGLPYQIFPGIFSSIDAFSKRIVHAWFDERHQAPPWLAPLGELDGYIEPPHWSKLTYHFAGHKVELRGSPDGILQRADGAHTVIDYKTSRFTKTQDKLYPMYAIQLNAYALLCEQNGISPVTALSLVYTEPKTQSPDGGQLDQFPLEGFDMPFSVHIIDVPLDIEQLQPLVAYARQIYDLPTPPPVTEGCKDCERLDGIAALLSQTDKRR